MRKKCGFNDADYYCEKRKLVPPPKAYSNMIKNLKIIEPLLKEFFYKLRKFMYEHLENFDVEVGENGKIFLSKAKGLNSDVDEKDARCDMDADYTIKENYYKDPKDGTTKVKKKTYFGYRCHLLADVNYELPIEFTVTKASLDEKKELMKHINMLSPEMIEKIVSLCADKGYDSEKVIEFLKSKEIKPIIDIRNQWRGNKTKQYKDTNIVYTYDGKVYYIEDNGDQKPMKYLGYDKVKDKLRYEHKGKVYGIEL